MQRRGLDPETRLVAARPKSAGEVVARALDLEVGSPIVYVERLRVASGEPLLLEQVHLPAERFPGLLASDLEHNSLYDVLTGSTARTLRAPANRSNRCCCERARRGCSISPRVPPRSSSKAWLSMRMATPLNSPGRSSAATEPATTSSASWCAQENRPSGSEPTLVAGLRPGQPVGS